jgi:hypothetical protein
VFALTCPFSNAVITDCGVVQLREPIGHAPCRPITPFVCSGHLTKMDFGRFQKHGDLFDLKEVSLLCRYIL